MSPRRFRSIKSFACAFVAFSVPIWPGLAQAEISAAERQVLGKLDVARAERQIESLSRIVDNDSGAGAGAATAGMADEAKIARYVEDELRALGFSVRTEPFPVRHYEHGTVRLVVEGKSIPAISYADGGGTWGTKDGVPFTAGNEGGGHVVRAPVIYVGAGYESDYQRAGDVKGKIVLSSMPGRPAVQILNAAFHGAAALLTFSESTADAPRLPDAIAQEPTGYHDQLPTVAISEASGKALRDRIASGHIEATLENRIDSSDGTSSNVIATIKGSEFPDEWIMVSAHYDRWWHAANDDEAGVATLLEVARALGRDFRPKRSIMFLAVGAEEFGLADSQFDFEAGSAAFVDAHPEVMRRLVYDRNHDLAGWTATKGMMLSSPEIAGAQRDVIKDLGLADRITTVPGQDVGTDAWAFGAVGGGATSLLVYASRMTEFRNAWDPKVEPIPFWQLSHTQFDLFKPEYYKNLGDELKITTLSVLRMDQPEHVTLQLTDVASWASDILQKDAAKTAHPGFARAQAAMTRLRDAAAMVDKMRSEPRSAARTASLNLWLLRVRHELMPWLYAQSESSFRTSSVADALASVGRIEAAIKKDDSSAVEEELGSHPLLLDMALSDQKVEDQIRLDFATSRFMGQRFQQIFRPASRELVAAYRRIKAGEEPSTTLPLIERARQRLTDDLEVALALIVGKTEQATNELLHSPGLAKYMSIAPPSGP